MYTTQDYIASAFLEPPERISGEAWGCVDVAEAAEEVTANGR
jgi:hypothetical protein